MYLKALCKPSFVRGGSQIKLLLRIMKLTAIILLLACMTAAATGFSQISLTEVNTPLQKVLKKIKKQSGYNFLVRYELVRDANPVSVKFNNVSLPQALEEVLKGQSLVFEVVDKTVIIRKGIIEKTEAQQLTLLIDVRGRIVNEKGEPMSGVSIVLKGTKKGTLTDINGEFILSGIEDNKPIIVVSYIGYQTQEIKAKGSALVTVRMAIETTEISNIVVTALGVKKEKKALTYSVQELGSKDLTGARDVNAANYLTGKIAGVQVSRTASGSGGSTKVIIRGVSSLKGENQPLYVVDGIPLDNSHYKEASDGGGNRNATAGHDFGDGIGNINPQDIESITVLKGPNATALYGSRGSNGVILITTKSGKGGNGIGVEISSGTTIEKVSRVPNVQNSYGPGYEDINVYGDIVQINGVNYETIPNDVSSYGPPMKGQLFANPFVFDPNAPLTTFALLPQPKDNIKDFWETGVVTNNTIALSGGTEKSSARLSVNNTTTKGITPNHKGDQQSINLRVNTKVGNKLSFDAKVNYIHKNVENTPNIGAGFENVLWALTELNRYVPLSFLKEYYESGGPRVRFPGVRYNPYYIVNELKNKAARERFVSFASVKYQFNDWLSLMARSGIDVYAERRRQTWPVGAQTSQSSGGRIIDENYLTKESNSDVLLTASKNDLGNNFSGSISLGASLLKRSNQLQGWDGNTLKVPGIYDISNAQNIKPYYSLLEKELQSVYAAGQIGYKNYLFLDITGRNDWSSTLGTNNYSFFYPSVGSSLIFTDAFKIHSKVLDFGKVRLSYAAAGNDAAAYLTESGYILNSTPIDGQSYASLDDNIPLFTLKNELKHSIEFGADLRFFNNRIGLDATFYKSNTKNQIVPVSISTASGYLSKVINAGNIQNTGVEISLNITPVELRNSFRWDLSFNFAKNQSKVIELAPGIETLPLYSGFPNSIEARTGEPYGNIVGYKYKRSPDGQKIVGDDGAYVKEDNVSVLGNVLPKWVGGLNNTFSFKKFTLNALVDFVQGNQITSFTRYSMTKTGTAAFTVEGREHSRPLDGVVEVKDVNGNVIKYEKNTQTVDGINYWARRAYDDIGEEFVMDGSYVMLREVILGYTFQPSLIKKTPFTGIRISLIGRNLFFIKDHMQGMGISPETVLNTQAGASGLETLSMPTTRNYGINFNFTF
ncbi:MAG: SusC/RagA family TonB-linked outer membrane protein [Ginsengibacter sp.]